LQLEDGFQDALKTLIGSNEDLQDVEARGGGGGGAGGAGGAVSAAALDGSGDPGAGEGGLGSSSSSSTGDRGTGPGGLGSSFTNGRFPSIQALFVGDLQETPIRNITSDLVNTLIAVPGIVINSSRTRPKATSIAIRCRNCNAERMLPVPPGYGGASLPRTCTAQQENMVNLSAGGGGAGGEAGDAGAGAGLGGDVAGPQQAKCPIDPYDVIAERSRYVDQQTLKLQEHSDGVPTGEMPRHLGLVVERQLADKVSPGTRISAIGIVGTVSAGAAGGSGRGMRGGHGVKSLYLKVVGVMVQAEGGGRALNIFTPEEEEEMRRLAREPKFFDRLAASVAPSISGDYTTDIKKAITCLLLAGSRRLLPDGVRLRGDINVLMLGDPSTAKSQFLKVSKLRSSGRQLFVALFVMVLSVLFPFSLVLFVVALCLQFVEKVAPVGVYTSGKGSSAAGLTASVIRDARGEFYLEGGAMVLGDGGVVCIDEFDKMREEDRVAIHEAMEQQTISVAKAGITTILNSRCAVLAAANPVFGRYDDTRSAADNIDLLPTILSRFDLIFIVRDVRNEARDAEIARHVMRVHMSADTAAGSSSGGGSNGDNAVDVPIEKMRRFINYARSRCSPTLTEEASEFLCSKYVEIRQEAKGRDADAREARLANSEEHSVIPITVRQLEALIRITESVAKAALSKEANVAHAEEAYRLFRVSTLNAAASGLSVLEAYMPPELQAAVQKIERRLGLLLPVGSSQATSRIKEQLLRSGFDESSINAAIRVMERRGELTLVNERKTIRRDR
jgi:DNA replication licensing factor MCM5